MMIMPYASRLTSPLAFATIKSTWVSHGQIPEPGTQLTICFDDDTSLVRAHVNALVFDTDNTAQRHIHLCRNTNANLRMLVLKSTFAGARVTCLVSGQAARLSETD